MTDTVAQKPSQNFIQVNLNGMNIIYSRKTHTGHGINETEKNNDALVKAIVSLTGGPTIAHENDKGEKSYLLKPMQKELAFFLYNKFHRVRKGEVLFFHKKGKGHTYSVEFLNNNEALMKYRALQKIIQIEKNRWKSYARFNPPAGEYDPLFSAKQQNPVLDNVLVALTLHNNGQEILWPNATSPKKNGILEAIVKINKKVTVAIRNGDVTGRFTETLTPNKENPTVIAFARPMPNAPLLMCHVLQEDVPAIITKHNIRPTLIQSVAQNLKERIRK